MPIDKYYGGHGSKVMTSMMKEYGEKKGKNVFYATANKRNAKPGDKLKKVADHKKRR